MHRDSVQTRLTSDGRAVTFVSTDLLAGRPLRFWACVATAANGDSNGTLIRLDTMSADEGWTVRQLLAVAHAWFSAEYAWSGAEAAGAARVCLDRAIAAYRDNRPGSSLAVTFEPGDAASPYVWTVARCGSFRLALCPDPESNGERVTPEQLLLVLDMVLSGWLPILPYRRSVWEARHAVRQALAIEVRRVAEFQGGPTATG